MIYGERSKSIPRIYLRWVWASHTLATQLAVSDFTGCGAVSVNWVRNPSVGDVITDWACDEGNRTSSSSIRRMANPIMQAGVMSNPFTVGSVSSWQLSVTGRG